MSHPLVQELPQESLRDVPQGSRLTVQDIAETRVVWVGASDPLPTALRAMRQAGTDCVLVRTGDDRRAFGIVTMRDVIEKGVAGGADAAELTVAQLMSTPVVTVTPEMSIRRASALVARCGIRRLPIFDGREVTGVLSDTAIFQLVEEGGWDRLD